MLDFQQLSNNLLNNIKNMKLSNIDAERGLGIIPDRIILDFMDNNNHISVEITNVCMFRIRDDCKIYLTFEDFYTDLHTLKEITYKQFNSQYQIEKSALSISIRDSKRLTVGHNVEALDVKRYGDIIFSLDNGIILEIMVNVLQLAETYYKVIDWENGREYSVIYDYKRFIVEEHEAHIYTKEDSEETENIDRKLYKSRELNKIKINIIDQIKKNLPELSFDIKNKPKKISYVEYFPKIFNNIFLQYLFELLNDSDTNKSKIEKAVDIIEYSLSADESISEYVSTAITTSQNKHADVLIELLDGHM